VEFSSDDLRIASMVCLTRRFDFAVVTLSLIALLPQFLALLAGLILYVIGMIG
jgi:hypothetical protein